MRTIHDGVINILKETISYNLIHKLVERKLKEQDISLSPSEIDFITKKILNGQLGPFKFDRWKFWNSKTVTLSLTEEDITSIESFLSSDSLVKDCSDVIMSVMIDGASDFLLTLKKSWPNESRRRKKEMNDFRKRLNQRWGVSLDKIELLVQLSLELGESINEELRNSADTPHPHVTDVLTRLHARACQITMEVICLLNNGLADGAMARWRTLHEISVVANLIVEHGEDLAKRYADHQIVESRKAMLQYIKYSDILDVEPMSDNEIKEIEDAYQDIKSMYGDDYTSDYGWAAKHLNRKNPKFVDLEVAAKIDRLRPYYKMASHNVHANPKGIYFKLGLLSDANFLLAGASNAGLVEPGHSTAISLIQISSTLVQICPTFDNVLCAHVMLKLLNEIGESLHQAHTRLEEDEQACQLEQLTNASRQPGTEL